MFVAQFQHIGVVLLEDLAESNVFNKGRGPEILNKIGMWLPHPVRAL
jgi:hypothetical protein